MHCRHCSAYFPDEDLLREHRLTKHRRRREPRPFNWNAAPRLDDTIPREELTYEEFHRALTHARAQMDRALQDRMDDLIFQTLSNPDWAPEHDIPIIRG